MAAFSSQNRSFSGQNQTFRNPVGISQPIFEFQGQKSPNDVINHLADQTTQFDIPEDGRFSYASCSEITTQAINLRPVSNTRPHDAENALRHLYDQSTMGYLGWQEIMNLIMIEQEQVAAALYGPSAGDCDANSLQDRNPKDGENHQTIADKKNCISKHSRFKVMDGQFSAHSDMDVHRGKVHAAHGKMKKGQTDQYDSESVIETYVQVSAQKGHLKKYNRVICKSSLSSNRTSKEHEENSKLKLNVSKGDPPELLPNIVQEEDKAPETQIDYIRVRARRGQATDRHSLAERARRERINKRMKILQNLVPGCNKITSKALVLEEIINYVQSLQKQVEILTMKLASVVPLDDLQHQISSLPYEEMQIDDTNMA